MFLVDKDIKARSQEIFLENYNESYVQPISYDIHVDEIITDSMNASVYQLQPGEMIMIRCKEKIKVPSDLAIRIENKNSLIRLGLTVTSPIYNPGHETPIYIRVQNNSGNAIKIDKDMAIAQMIFEKLSSTPEVPYNKKNDASFNEENKYRGLSNYQDSLKQRMTKINQVKEDIENKEASIYANILTMMGIFVSIFSLITINFSSINNSNFNKDFILTMNLSLGIIISLFLGIIMLFINRKHYTKWHFISYISILVVLIIALFVLV